MPGALDVPATALVHIASPETQVVALAPHDVVRCALLNPERTGLASCSLLSADDHGTCAELALQHGVLGARRRDASTTERVSAVRAPAAGRSWIATTPGISEMTVKKHFGHVLRKLALHDRLQLGLAVARCPLSFSERRGIAGPAGSRLVASAPPDALFPCPHARRRVSRGNALERAKPRR